MSYLEELLPEFRKGAKIRQKRWKDGAYIEKLSQGIIYHYVERHEVDILADDYEFYQEPEPDWDYIIKNKCLCWFWCKDEEERKIAGYLADYDSYNNQFGRYKGKTIAVTYFDYCRPVRRDEVTFYEERKDE